VSEAFAQRQVVVAHPLFSLLGLVDVRARRIPPQEMSLVIPQRVVLDEKPPKLSVVPPDTLFVGKRGPARHCCLAFVVQPRHVVRMKHPGPKVRGHHLVQGETDVREDGLIRTQSAPIRSEDNDSLGDGVDDPTQLLFVVPESRFRLLQIIKAGLRLWWLGNRSGRVRCRSHDTRYRHTIRVPLPYHVSFARSLRSTHELSP
jgi:hypothetical protein